MIDERSQRNIDTLIPAAQEKAVAFLNAVEQSNRLPAGWKVKIICGTRTYSDQAELYAKGRTKPGRVVTNAKPGYSWHNFGIAFDVGVFDERGVYIDDAYRNADEYYAHLGPIGRAVGLEWGGDWRSIKDVPHYQLRLGYDLAEARRRLSAGESLTS